jgi:hypothetical protein
VRADPDGHERHDEQASIGHKEPRLVDLSCRSGGRACGVHPGDAVRHVLGEKERACDVSPPRMQTHKEAEKVSGQDGGEGGEKEEAEERIEGKGERWW